jgi:hypothetical protein
MSNNITAFVLGLEATYEGEHGTFGLLSLANFASDDLLQFHPFACDKLNRQYYPRKLPMANHYV